MNINTNNTGKVFITGGSRGIGRECVRLFCERGYAVTFQYNKSEEAARSLCLETGARSVKCDFRDSGCIDAMVREAGECDILVNCAGISKTGLMTDMDNLAYRELMSVNLDSVFYLCRAFLPAMVRKKSGSIVNISSVWGMRGASCEAAYSASKGGIIALTKAIAKEYGPSGITCNCVCPGAINTDMNACYSKEDMDTVAEDTPLMRIGSPREVAEAVLFLAEAKFVTGQALACDGGWMI